MNLNSQELNDLSKAALVVQQRLFSCAERARFLNPRSDMIEPTASSSPTPSLPSERRLQGDRRRSPTRFLSLFRLCGRRRGFRRQGEGKNQYVDCLMARIVVLTLAVVVFSSLDALFTLLHLESGAEEMNPLMRLALLGGLPVFLGLKTWGTGLGALFLAVHQNFHISWLALHGVAVAYGVLLAYHVLLFLR